MKTAFLGRVGLTKSSHGTNIVEETSQANRRKHITRTSSTALTALGDRRERSTDVKDYTASGAIAEKSGTVTLSGTSAHSIAGESDERHG